MVPANRDDLTIQYHVRELDGTYVLRDIAAINHHLQPGRWVAYGEGHHYFLRTPPT